MENLQEAVTKFRETFLSAQSNLQKIIVGQHETILFTLSTIFAGGHVLLEGAPGLGKTLLVKTLGEVLGLSFKRIQFTPDLMPADVTGTQVLAEDENGKRQFVFKEGPLFTHILLADEINRATPKTQSALLEAMEEKQVTVMGETRRLPLPFFVLATQNPVELEGTYPLPEAQLDRFMVKVLVPSPTGDELKEVLNRTTGNSVFTCDPIFEKGEERQQLLFLRSVVREVVVAPPLQEVIVRIISALTPDSPHATKQVNSYVRFGPGPRGAQSLLFIAKTLALLDGRVNVSFEDIKKALLPTLRHRIILQFQAEAEGVDGDMILDEIRKAK